MIEPLANISLLGANPNQPLVDVKRLAEYNQIDKERVIVSWTKDNFRSNFKILTCWKDKNLRVLLWFKKHKQRKSIAVTYIMENHRQYEHK